MVSLVRKSGISVCHYLFCSCGFDSGAFLAMAWRWIPAHHFYHHWYDHVVRTGDKKRHPYRGFANQLKTQGYSVVEALVEAGKERLRPSLWLTFAMILGMLPFALSKSPSSEFKNGMAWVLIGGLTSYFPVHCSLYLQCTWWSTNWRPGFKKRRKPLSKFNPLMFCCKWYCIWP